MPKNKYTIKKFDGDDVYSWAVFKADDVKGMGNQIFYGQARPVVSGESRGCAAAIRDRLNKEANG